MSGSDEEDDPEQEFFDIRDFFRRRMQAEEQEYFDAIEHALADHIRELGDDGRGALINHLQRELAQGDGEVQPGGGYAMIPDSDDGDSNDNDDNDDEEGEDSDDVEMEDAIGQSPGGGDNQGGDQVLALNFAADENAQQEFINIDGALRTQSAAAGYSSSPDLEPRSMSVAPDRRPRLPITNGRRSPAIAGSVDRSRSPPIGGPASPVDEPTSPVDEPIALLPFDPFSQVAQVFRSRSPFDGPRSLQHFYRSGSPNFHRPISPGDEHISASTDPFDQSRSPQVDRSRSPFDGPRSPQLSLTSRLSPVDRAPFNSPQLPTVDNLTLPAVGGSLFQGPRLPPIAELSSLPIPLTASSPSCPTTSEASTTSHPVISRSPGSYDLVTDYAVQPASVTPEALQSCPSSHSTNSSLRHESSGSNYGTPELAPTPLSTSEDDAFEDTFVVLNSNAELNHEEQSNNSESTIVGSNSHVISDHSNDSDQTIIYNPHSNQEHPTEVNEMNNRRQEYLPRNYEQQISLEHCYATVLNPLQLASSLPLPRVTNIKNPTNSQSGTTNEVYETPTMSDNDETFEDCQAQQASCGDMGHSEQLVQDDCGSLENHSPNRNMEIFGFDEQSNQNNANEDGDENQSEMENEAKMENDMETSAEQNISIIVIEPSTLSDVPPSSASQPQVFGSFVTVDPFEMPKTPLVPCPVPPMATTSQPLIILDQPPSSGSILDQPQTSGSILDQPSTSCSILDQPSTSGTILDQPSTSGTILDQPSTSAVKSTGPSDQIQVPSTLEDPDTQTSYPIENPHPSLISEILQNQGNSLTADSFRNPDTSVTANTLQNQVIAIASITSAGQHPNIPRDISLNMCLSPMPDVLQTSGILINPGTSDHDVLQTQGPAENPATHESLQIPGILQPPGTQSLQNLGTPSDPDIVLDLGTAYQGPSEQPGSSLGQSPPGPSPGPSQLHGGHEYQALPQYPPPSDFPPPQLDSSLDFSVNRSETPDFPTDFPSTPEWSASPDYPATPEQASTPEPMSEDEDSIEDGVALEQELYEQARFEEMYEEARIAAEQQHLLIDADDPEIVIRQNEVQDDDDNDEDINYIIVQPIQQQQNEQDENEDEGYIGEVEDDVEQIHNQPVEENIEFPQAVMEQDGQFQIVLNGEVINAENWQQWLNNRVNNQSQNDVIELRAPPDGNPDVVNFANQGFVQNVSDENGNILYTIYGINYGDEGQIVQGVYAHPNPHGDDIDGDDELSDDAPVIGPLYTLSRDIICNVLNTSLTRVSIPAIEQGPSSASGENNIQEDKIDWSLLPLNIVTEIFRYLSDPDRVRMAKTCKKWHSLLNSAVLWRVRIVRFHGSGTKAKAEAKRLKGWATSHGHWIQRLSIYCDHPSYVVCRTFQKAMTDFFGTLLWQKAALKRFCMRRLYVERYWRYDTVRERLVGSLSRFFKRQNHLQYIDLSDGHWGLLNGLKLLEAVAQGCKGNRRLATLNLEDFFSSRLSLFRLQRYQNILTRFKVG